jgi:heme-degrading monooxygenase HmoA
LFGLKAAAITDNEKSAPAAAERYVVFNRFTVRDNAGPRFEKRWADRKSSLKVLDGFRFFTLLRRADGVSVSGRVIEYEEGTPDYMSMTIWQTKKNFNSWRTGYAFKEAHGGGSIGGFLSAMLGSMMVIKTPPTPAMWDAVTLHTHTTHTHTTHEYNTHAHNTLFSTSSAPALCYSGAPR